MDAVVTILHVIVCVFLVAVVLLQRGKGAQIGAVFGGGAGATMFGGRGAGSFLSRLTAGAAAIFMITSLSLSYLGITGASDRLFEDGAAQEESAEAPLFEELGTVPPAGSDAPASPDAAAPAAEAQPPAPATGTSEPAASEASPAEPAPADAPPAS
jgi:preprotein translocase subunit SecG